MQHSITKDQGLPDAKGLAIANVLCTEVKRSPQQPVLMMISETTADSPKNN